MKIGIVCPYSFDVPGGVQFHVRDLAEYYLAQGHEVSVLAPAEGDDVPDYVVSSGRATPIKYNGSVARLNFGPVTASKASRWIDNGRFDVLHLHEPITPSVGVLALLAANGPIVATFHTSMIRSRALQSAFPLVRSSLEKIAGRIAVSEDARRTVTTHLGGDAVVIPNGVYAEKFASAARKPEWEGTPQAPTIAFLGRLGEPRKGLAVLLAAMPQVLAEVPGARLLIAGPGEPDKVAKDLPPEVERACEFLGSVSDEDKASLLRSVDVYEAPNTGGESFGIILIETMAAGAPVVASNLPAFTRVLDGGSCGAVFANEDPADLANQLVELLRDPARRDELSALGSERAQQFDWSVVAEQVMTVYEAVIEAADHGRQSPPTGRWSKFVRASRGTQ